MWARFVAAYGIGTWMNPCWPTTDHVIPWGVFALALIRMPSVRALQRYDEMRAVRLGTGAGPGLTDAINKTFREAYPEMMELD